ncbi:hypothetical protein O181_066455 [Austropuccinia psidii MF-1]|uniref:Retrovirus-related Pol polyprotein from transposon TNT 1-94-like beta-barrel domain-containing protein n=1 Tax=Austropuccinia psidii MF-1 TaxID=1389203 RepID=A0A9Q3EP23_9BASI|nr:hypothetical protein [Austropuccinia psidii MF-1]
MSTALTTSLDELHKIIYYCSNGKHNNKCTTHRKAEFWAENPHLRPNRKEKKRKNNPAAHLSMVQALTTLSLTQQPSSNQIFIDCGATHHMFNSTKFFPGQIKPITSEVGTGDSQSNLKALGIGEVQLRCNEKTLKLENCLFVPNLKCNLVSMLELFKNRLIVHRRNNTFSLMANGKTLLNGEIIN